MEPGPLLNLREFIDSESQLRAVATEIYKRYPTQAVASLHEIKFERGVASQGIIGYHVLATRELDMHSLSRKCACQPEQEWIEGVRSPLWTHKTLTRLM